MRYKTGLSSHNSSITASASVSASLCTDCQNFHLPKGSHIQQQRRGNCAQMSCSLAEQIAHVVLLLRKWWGWRAEGKVREKLSRTDEQQETNVQFWFFPHFATLTVCQYFVTLTRQGRAARWQRDRTGWESAPIQASEIFIFMSTWDTSSKSCHLPVPGLPGKRERRYLSFSPKVFSRVGMGRAVWLWVNHAVWSREVQGLFCLGSCLRYTKWFLWDPSLQLS